MNQNNKTGHFTCYKNRTFSFATDTGIGSTRIDLVSNRACPTPPLHALHLGTKGITCPDSLLSKNRTALSMPWDSPSHEPLDLERQHVALEKTRRANTDQTGITGCLQFPRRLHRGHLWSFHSDTADCENRNPQFRSNLAQWGVSKTGPKTRNTSRKAPPS